MSKPASLQPQRPGFNFYVVVCLAALAVLLVLLVQRVHELFRAWALFPIIVGVFAVIFRWRSGPVLFLVALAGYLYASTMRSLIGAHPQLRDWMLSGVVLAFVMAHYRLQGLDAPLLPTDPRKRSPTSASKTSKPKPAFASRVITPRESGQYLLAVALWAAVGQVVIRLLPAEPHFLGFPPVVVQLLLLTWLIVVISLVVAAVLNALRLEDMTHEEAALFLQDTLWRETRREQRRWHRWHVWAMLRQQRREGRR